MKTQTGILADVPAAGRYLTFQLLPGQGLTTQLGLALRALVDALPPEAVCGIGPMTVARLGKSIAGLREPACLAGPEISLPVTPAALWVWLRGVERGELVHQAHAIEAAVVDAFVLEDVVDGFLYGGGRDLTGYEDGTENPRGDAANAAAIVCDSQAGLEGSSFVAVQTWAHDLGGFAGFSTTEQDHIIGRRRSDNEELDDAPEYAHVKRTAQERFEPEAFVLRRSMPWADGDGEGLVFVAFGASFDAFEAQLRRMVGLDDGITDGLFRFTQPRTSAYFWCPPMHEGKLDLSALGM